jgi:hypothetical protein
LETGFCLSLEVKITQLGPIDRASPHLRTSVPVVIRTQSLPNTSLEICWQTKLLGYSVSSHPLNNNKINIVDDTFSSIGLQRENTFFMMLQMFYICFNKINLFLWFIVHLFIFPSYHIFRAQVISLLFSCSLCLSSFSQFFTLFYLSVIHTSLITNFSLHYNRAISLKSKKIWLLFRVYLHPSIHLETEAVFYYTLKCGMYLTLNCVRNKME